MKMITITGAESFEQGRHYQNETIAILAKGGDGMQVSDGYHTMDELYDHRITLFLALGKVQDAFSVLGRVTGQKGHRVWKSKAHHPEDKPMFDDWFVMGIDVEEGYQITYHLPLDRWDEANFEELEHAPKWDGHTPADVLDRLKKL